MTNKRVYSDYIQDIANSITEIEEFVKDLSFEDFVKDAKTINAVIRSLLEVIGEAAKNIPSWMRDKYSQLPWRKMTGMRDKLIHEYFGIDLEAIWETVQKDIPNLRPLIEEVQNETNLSTFTTKFGLIYQKLLRISNAIC